MKVKILILSIFCTILFSLFVSAQSSFNVNIMYPENNSIIKGDFFIVDVTTDVNAICNYIVDGGAVNEMEFTGGLDHSSSIIGVSEASHNIGVFCEDIEGNISYNSVDITVSLGETRKYLLLENISDYSYFYSLPLEKSPGVTKNYVAVYKKDNILNFVTYYKFTDNETALNFTNDLLPEGKILMNLNGMGVYAYDGLGTKHIAWNQGNEVIYIMAVPINDETSADIPLPLVDYYLVRYPSDLENKLIIRSVDVDASGFSFDDIENGDTLNETFIGGTTLDVIVRILNNYTIEENKVFTDAIVNITVKNTQTDFVDNFISLKQDIFPQALTIRSLLVDLPNENGLYEINIIVKGKLENDIIYSNEKNFFVNLEEKVVVDVEDFIELRNVVISDNEATCGENVTISADVFNGGDDGNSEKVKIGLINQELGVDLFTIHEDLTEGETHNFYFTIQLDNTLENKNYELILKGERYDVANEDYIYADSAIINLIVSGCEPTQPIVAIEVEDLYKVFEGTSLVAEVNITNLLNESGFFEISVDGYQAYATLGDISLESIFLEPNETKNIEIILDINEGMLGHKTFNIIVEHDGRTETKTINVHIDEEPILVSSFTITKKQELTKSQVGKIEIKNDGNLTQNIILSEETSFGIDFSASEFSLLPGESKIVELNLPFNPNFDIGTNLVRINAIGNNNIKKSIDFNVKETFCELGEKGTLRIKDVTIDNKGEGDDNEWMYLDELTIEVEVENTGNDLEDIVVQLGLYNSESNRIGELDFQSSDEEEFELGDLDEGDEETAEFDFIVPADMEGGSYKLVVKAYSEESSESVECIDTSSDLSDDVFESVKIKEEEDEGKYILFDNFIISPLEVSCTDIVTVSGDIYNIGKKDQDKVRINLKNTQIGINEGFVLDNFDKGDNKRINFEFVVPSNKPGSYSLELNAEYDYRSGSYREKSDKTINIPLKVTDCNVNLPDENIDNYTDEIIYLNKKKTNEEENNVGFFEFIFNSFKEVFGKK